MQLTSGDKDVIFVHVAYGRGSVLLRQGDEIPKGTGQFFPNWQLIVAVWISLRKKRFRLNLIIYRKVWENSIFLLFKAIIVTNYFEITGKLQ